MVMSTDTFQLPVIDIGPYLVPDLSSVEERYTVSKALHDACVEYGFFYLNISKYVKPSEPEELIRLARDFFALPQEEKDRISVKYQDYARGYQRLKENVTNGMADNHEAIDLYKPNRIPDKSKILGGENQWPSIPTFETKYLQWIDKMKKLGMIVMDAMAAGLGLSEEERKQLCGQVDDSFWVMRIIGYPPLPNDDDGFSCGAHKDYGCLTFLHADPTRSALQVFLPRNRNAMGGDDNLQGESEDEGIWINADPVPGCIVCNIGEMWEIWTNGLYKSTLHRVIHRGTNYRVSIPFFFEPNFTAQVEPIPSALIKTGGTEMYKPVIYGDFLLKKVGGNFAIDGTRDRY